MLPHLSVSNEAKSQVEELIKSSVNSGEIPPFFFAACSADGPLVSFNFGNDQDGKPITNDTLLRIASMTKLISSMRVDLREGEGGEGGGREMERSSS